MGGEEEGMEELERRRKVKSKKNQEELDEGIWIVERKKRYKKS